MTRNTLISVLLLAALGCGDGSEEGSAQIGSACTADTDCTSGWCFTDPSFKDNYCSMLKCGKDTPCPEGSTCHAYKGHSFCLASCSEGSCREGYVCDYKVCRPACKLDGDCQGSDKCMAGRCKTACKKDTDCTNGRCQDGKCVGPCKADSNCLPGYSCDVKKGSCAPKKGVPMGGKCAKLAECATGYCLPTTKKCSILCNSTSQCPSAYVCGLERLDLDNNGTPDGAHTACVPIKGKGKVTQNCARDADCQSNHCYYGFCMEGCKTDKDCGSHKCSQVNLLLGGAIPKYKGCLPRSGTSFYSLGAVTPGKVMGLDIPPGAGSFTLTAQVGDTSVWPYITELKNPKGTVLTELTTQCKEYAVPNRYNADAQVSTVLVPNNSGVKLEPGLHTYMLGITKSGLSPQVTVQLKMGQAQKGTIQLNWVFLNLASTCVPPPLLNSTSAKNHAWFSKLRNNLQSILLKAGITVSKETYGDLSDPSLDIVDLSAGAPTELYKLFASSKGKQGKIVNIFLVREIKSASMGGTVLGFAGGIPGPPAIHGTAHSGVTMSMIGVCYEKLGYNPAHTMAHEVGHFLGLWHNIERESYPGWSDTKKDVVCPCPCGKNMVCYKETSRYGFQWCRGMDPISDTGQENDNLMYWAAESTQLFKGNKLSKGQIRAVLNNPLVGY